MDKSSLFLRFPLSYRIEHWILAVNFSVLALTGLVQKFPVGWFSMWFVGLAGGVENVRTVHHAAAVIMVVEALVHLGVVRYRAYVRLAPSKIVPTIEDVKVAFQAFFYNLGLTRNLPKYGRYTFVEKAEYYAVVWGTLIMVLTGLMMWNPVATTRMIPGEFIPAAKSAHGAEAILAVLAILVWHFYFVLIKHFNPSMFTGYLPVEMMRREHPLELADKRSGEEVKELDADALIRFRKFCLPQYVLLSAIIVAIFFVFINFEDTTTPMIRPMEDVVPYAPLVQAEAVTEPPLYTWEIGVFSILSAKCTSCHNESAPGGLDLLEYGKAMDSGAIIPGDPEHSPLVIKMEQGGHPGQMNDYELTVIRRWIADGAPLWYGSGSYNPEKEVEQPEETGETSTVVPEAGLTWMTGIAEIFSAGCGMCHGSAEAGGLNLTVYRLAMESGVIIPGYPEDSWLVGKIAPGNHSAQLSPEDLELVKEWIRTGAPESVTSGPWVAPVEPPSEGQPAAPVELVYTWTNGIADIFAGNCMNCHDSKALGGLNLTDYSLTMSADVIVAGDPSASLIVTKIEAGNHMGHLTDEELEKVREWILSGAVE
jgi:cytochrome b subunit of formate dehydrogenase